PVDLARPEAARGAPRIPRARPAGEGLRRRGLPVSAARRRHDDAGTAHGARVGTHGHRRERKSDRIECMSAQLLTSAAAQPVRDAALKEIKSLATPPKVVAVHNPESPAARYYLRAQKKTCAEAGVAYEVRTLIRDLNRDPQVSGITVHTPLPAGVDQDAVMGAILPSKDIEGIHPENLGRLAFGTHRPAPCAA